MTHRPDHEVELFKVDDAYEIIVDLPGYDRTDVDLHWHDGRLHVTAEHRNEDGQSRVLNRHVSVPRRVDPDGIDATFRDDVLTVTLPIVEDGVKPGTPIEVGE